MLGSQPRFPAFVDWQNMSEAEQDALLDKLETAKRRGTVANRLLIVMAAAAVCVAVVLVLKFW
jgi:CHASE3 domain sensor protein